MGGVGSIYYSGAERNTQQAAKWGLTLSAPAFFLTPISPSCLLVYLAQPVYFFNPQQYILKGLLLLFLPLYCYRYIGLSYLARAALSRLCP